MRIAEADRALLLPSGKQSVAENHAGWACVYLRKDGLMTRTGRGMYAITPEGKRMLAERGDRLSLSDLEQYESFRAFRYGTDGQDAHEAAPPMPDVSPQDAMDAAFSQMNDDLADEGIDGIIREDKLGFSSIYIQAKRWDPETTVGRPEIQKFVGALAGQGAQKGLFITTASFSREAQQYACHQLATRVVLVDGRRLARLMIEYNVGVAAQTTYVVKRIDSDFFDEDNG